MRSRIQTVVLPSEAGELGEEIRRLFQELGRASGGVGLTGECAPTVDVFETDEAITIVMDVPGVDREAVRVMAKGDVVLIAGHKRQRTQAEATFHLVERGFGRFARTVRLTRACNTARASAVLADGELRVTVPKVAERRGRRIDVPVAGQSDRID